MNVGTRLYQKSRKIIDSKQFLRLKSFDVSTEEGRSKERYRRIVLTGLFSFLAKGISVGTALISVPLTVNYLGTERYGLWATISSFMALLQFADFGLGNGLLNAVSEANGKDDRNLIQQYASSAFFLLSGIAVLIGVLFFFVHPFIPWYRIFNVSSPRAIAEAGPAVAVFIACTILHIPLGIVQRIQLGFQEGFANSIWNGFGSLISLGFVLLAIYFQAGLPLLVLALAGSPILALLMNGLFLFGKRYSWLRPSWQYITGPAVRKIFSLGFLFFILQLAVAVGFQSDNIVLAQILGADQVTQYAVPKRLFALMPMILSFVINPLWPAYGEAIARKDVKWVKNTLKKSLVLSISVTAPVSILLVLFGRQFIRLWVGPQIQASTTLLIGLGFWILINSVLNPVAMLMNGASVVKFQIVSATLMAAVNISLSILLVHQIGVSGVIYGTIIAQFTCSLLPVAIYIPRLLLSMEE